VSTLAEVYNPVLTGPAPSPNLLYECAGQAAVASDDATPVYYVIGPWVDSGAFSQLWCAVAATADPQAITLQEAVGVPGTDEAPSIVAAWQFGLNQYTDGGIDVWTGEVQIFPAGRWARVIALGPAPFTLNAALRGLHV